MGTVEGKGKEPLMAPARILLTGAGGQLGTDIAKAAAKSPNVALTALDRSALDITDRSAVLAAVDAASPEVILHCAAYTAVDACETDELTAISVNGLGTSNVVEAAKRVGARMIYPSTDYVFDGSKPGPYIETDQPKPASVYGRSKLIGEEATRELGPDGLIVRTSWVCGVHGSNMVKTILRVAETHDTLTFVDDQVGKPTFTSDLAAALLTLSTQSELELGPDGADGNIFHITNEVGEDVGRNGGVSWFDFCREVLSAAGLDPERVKPCATEELQPPRPAPRPANSVLANTRFGQIGLPLLRDFRDPLRETVRSLTGS